MKILLVTIFSFLSFISFSQKLIYSEIDRDDSRNMNYNIIGKTDSKVVIYKGGQKTHFICVYDANMQLLEKNILEIDTEGENLLKIEFIWYDSTSLVFYQYQKKNIVYSNVAKINAFGKILEKPKSLDQHIASNISDSKYYNYLVSANKKNIGIYKVDNENEKLHKVSLFLYNEKLELINSSYKEISMKENNSFLSCFEINNNGDLVFIKAIGQASGINIKDVTIFNKNNGSDSIKISSLKYIENVFFDDEIKIKSNNNSNDFYIIGLYSNKKRGNIMGLYNAVFSSTNNTSSSKPVLLFDDKFRDYAKGQSKIKQAFDNYFIKNVITKKNGGFLVFMEAETFQNNQTYDNWNRWDNGGFYNNSTRLGTTLSPYGMINSTTRYFSDNIAICSIDSVGLMEWNNVITSSLFDDNTNNYLSYGLFNAGNEIKVLTNKLIRQDFYLNEYRLTPYGNLSTNTTLKNLDKGYKLQPRFAKQIGLKQIIVPCYYQSFLCFAKIEY